MGTLYDTRNRLQSTPLMIRSASSKRWLISCRVENQEENLSVRHKDTHTHMHIYICDKEDGSCTSSVALKIDDGGLVLIIISILDKPAVNLVRRENINSI